VYDQGVFRRVVLDRLLMLLAIVPVLVYLLCDFAMCVMIERGMKAGMIMLPFRQHWRLDLSHLMLED